jgi:hypothetical protein
MVSEPPFLWPPIKRYSRFFFGAPSGGRPFPADCAVNAVFPLFLWCSFRWPPISGQPRRQFLRQLLPEPIVLPPTPISAKRTTKSGVSAPDRWICAISAYSALHTHYAPPQTTDQTLRVQIRRDHRRPSFHAPTRASRRICLFANALHALPRAAMVIHALPRAGTSLSTRRHSPAAPPTRSHALWNNLTRF